MLTTEEKLLCAVAHLGIFAGMPVIAPLVVYVLANSEFVKDQAKQAMVFQIGLAIMATIGVLTIILLVGIFILMAVGVMTLVFPIIATFKSIDGERYRYPITGDIADRI